MNSGSGGGDIFDVKKVRRLVELMKEHDLAEIDLRQADQRIRLRRGAEPLVATGTQAAQAPSHAAMSAPAAAPTGIPAASAPAAGDEAGALVIKSPMVGTFYASPNPESAPFVKVGDHVGPETVVCIIEAMKVFNQVPAEVAGQITAVLVDTGEAVEYGQPLFRVAARK